MLADEILQIDNDSPIFIFGCSWRCGSTLLQRYINSTNRAFIWGEQNGLIDTVIRSFAELEKERELSDYQQIQFNKTLHLAWIANLNPPMSLTNILKTMLNTYYERTFELTGLRRWGFKEVRYDAVIAKQLLDSFPHARVVFLIRNPRDVLASSSANDWHAQIGGSRKVADQWCRAVKSFTQLSDQRLLIVKYEELVERLNYTTRQLSDHIGIDFDLFDPKIPVHKVRGSLNSPRLGKTELLELRREDICFQAERLGYDLRLN